MQGILKEKQFTDTRKFTTDRTFILSCINRVKMKQKLLSQNIYCTLYYYKKNLQIFK